MIGFEVQGVPAVGLYFTFAILQPNPVPLLEGSGSDFLVIRPGDVLCWEVKLGCYIATEPRTRLGRYEATELKPSSVAT
ncbi:hypothetical protein F2Q68_00043879 [Brassica cretica]|uniref:Uncharacterized protein n=1 Tax=Brassica cretica TaxID=69181 RepID=A0A8S9LKV4_BRACR|nr:hypothetical protein F2Q68_00043879 [Brassica cretica]